MPALKIWHDDPGRAQLNFLDSLRLSRFKVAHRTDNHFALAFSAGGDGGRRSPEHLARN